MNQLPTFISRTLERRGILLTLAFVLIVATSSSGQEGKLERMPADLETDLALSSMPPHLRDKATVYLLDPEKGYYVGRQGTNGFICFVLRTDWEWVESRDDIATPISYDAEGAKTIFPAYADVEVMRASGKFTPAQIKATMTDRYNKGYYKAPARPGVSYMLAPLMRSHDGQSPTIATFSLPHYMFYAPYLTDADIGGNPESGGLMILGDGKGPHGYMIIPAGVTEKAKILEENKDLINRLVAYKPYFQIRGGVHH